MSAATFGLASLGLGLGAVLGALLERAHFCTMGAIADLVLFRSWRRARTWLAVLAASLVVVQGAALAGAGGLDAVAWPVRSLALGLVGGVLFGLGMVLAGGCASRLWVRAGSGSGKAGLALAVMVAMALATLASGVLDVTEPAARVGGGAVAIRVAGIVGGSALFAWAAPWRDRPTLGLVGALAAAIVIGWHVAALGGAPTTVSYQPALALAAAGEDLAAWAFVLTLLAGTLAGAGWAAARADRFGRERIADGDDLRRHLLGGAAMGVGGTLAGGCTLGAGVGGVALLAPSAVLALGGMVLGAAWMVHVLASGGWRAALRALAS